VPFAIIRGGFGEFRAPIPQSLFPSVQSANGTAESQLICVGPQVPSPDWAGFAGRLRRPAHTMRRHLGFPRWTRSASAPARR